MKRTIWVALLFFIVAGRTLAQTDCPAIVQTALALVADACTNLGRNQACYGNVNLEAEPLADAAFTFEQTGDVVNLSDVASLRLSAMDTDEESWGIALLRTQANLPDTLPGQNVTMVLFGEVTMTDAAPGSAEAASEQASLVFQASNSNVLNVRSLPSTNGEIVTSLSAGSTFPINGRNEAGDWLHVQLEDGSTGWVLATLVSVDGDVNQLPITDGAPVETTEEVISYTPMQAFYFSSGIGDSQCAQTPDSGILIQTPEGAGTINLLVNEAAITLGSTAYVQAGAGEMTLNVIEGHGTVSAFGTTVTIPAGSRARIPINDQGAASGPPVGPEPYDETTFSALPVVLLPQQVTIAAPTTAEQITSDTSLYIGSWTMTATFDCGMLGAGEVVLPYEHSEAFYGWDTPLTELQDALGVLFPFPQAFTDTLSELESSGQLTIPGSHTKSEGGVTAEINIISATSITGTVDYPEVQCVMDVVLEANV